MVDTITQDSPITLADQLDQIAADASIEKAAALAGALAEYRSLIQRHDNPLPGDARSLLSLIGMLGITDSDVKADIAAFDSAGQLSAKLMTEDQLTAEDFNREAEASKADTKRRKVLADLVRQVNSPEQFIVAIANWFSPDKMPLYSGAMQVFGTCTQEFTVAEDRVRQPRRLNSSIMSQLDELQKNHPRVFSND